MDNSVAIVLFSGGIDSTVCLAHTLAMGNDVVTLSFDYGQKHSRELYCQKRILEMYASKNGVRVNKIIHAMKVHIDSTFMRSLNSSLTTTGMSVPTERTSEEMKDGIPSTYVPGRNTIFMSYAFALAESLQKAGVKDVEIVIGANAIDYSGYPDCRQDYFEAWRQLIRMARANTTKKLTRIDTPLLTMTKAQIIRRGTTLRAPLHLTSSCYKAEGESGKACGVCDSCIIRKKGFEEAHVPDPTIYV